MSRALLDWSVKGRGNYYSDNAAFDLEGTGIATAAYRPNDLMDHVIWRAPTTKMLLNSPAVQVVKWAQAQFPAIHPGGVVDTAPLMKPPHPWASTGCRHDRRNRRRDARRDAPLRSEPRRCATSISRVQAANASASSATTERARPR